MKVRDWPTPSDDFEKATLLCKLLYRWLPESKYKIMIRKHGFAIAGIIEDTNHPVPDSQYGKRLPWVEGFIPNENKHFELVEYTEPRNQKLVDTGELKNVILDENDYFILCARNSRSISDDEDNYTWEPSENEIKQMMALGHHNDLEKIAISDLTDKVNEYRMISNNLQTQAETYARESIRLHDKTNLLQQENLDLHQQIAELYRQNKILSTNKIRDESKLAEIESNAGDIGRLQGMDKLEIIQEAADSFQQVMTSMDSLSKGEMSQNEYNDLKNEMKKNYDDLKEGVDGLKEKHNKIKVGEKSD